MSTAGGQAGEHRRLVEDGNRKVLASCWAITGGLHAAKVCRAHRGPNVGRGGLDRIRNGQDVELTVGHRIRIQSLD